MPRLDSRLEAVGAEFLVLGQLLIQGMQCYKSYINHPGYDLTATNPKTKKLVRIQVKSRWATDYNKSFPIKNFNCDFIVLVALNRGARYRKTTKANTKKEPEFYILPTYIVRKAQKKSSGWNTASLSEMGDYRSYKNRWDLIEKELS